MNFDDTREKIQLQVTQSQFKIKEAEKKLNMARKNINSAEENLRCANLGFKEGVMDVTDVMAAQTARQQAQSQKIDAEIDVKLTCGTQQGTRYPEINLLERTDITHTFQLLHIIIYIPMSKKSQHNNILLAVIGFTAVVILVGIIGFFTLERDEDTIQGEVEVSEYRVSCKLPVPSCRTSRQGRRLCACRRHPCHPEVPEMKSQEQMLKATNQATEALKDLTDAGARKEQIQGSLSAVSASHGSCRNSQEDLWSYAEPL